VHIPYKGSPESIHEVLAGRVDFAFAPVSVAQPFVQAGKARALAVSPSKRSTLLPNVPTTVEAGLPGSSYESWLVALAPAKTPVPALVALNAVFNKALESPEIVQRFNALGVEPDPMSLQELGAFVGAEYDKAMVHARQSPASKNR
jgi:tripartite-type tricarboxylate transporter receptor subunit TctC